MSAENVCEHCKREFTTKGSLVRHQLTAKKCAKSRNLDVEQKFQCSYCEYGAYFKTDFNKHAIKCSAKNKNSEEKEIERLKNELSERDKKLLIRDAKIEMLEKIAQCSNINNTDAALNALLGELRAEYRLMAKDVRENLSVTKEQAQRQNEKDEDRKS